MRDGQEITVRSANEADIEALCKLNAQLGYPADCEVLKARVAFILNHPAHKLFVACVGGNVIGYVHGFEQRMLIMHPFVEVGSLVVDEAWRSKGVGKILMQRIENWTKQQGCHLVLLHSNIVRERAHQFYLNFGYRLLKTSRVFIKDV